MLLQDESIGSARGAGCGKKDGERWSTDGHLGITAHGENRSVATIQYAW